MGVAGNKQRSVCALVSGANGYWSSGVGGWHNCLLFLLLREPASQLSSFLIVERASKQAQESSTIVEIAVPI